MHIIIFKVFVSIHSFIPSTLFKIEVLIPEIFTQNALRICVQYYTQSLCSLGTFNENSSWKLKNAVKTFYKTISNMNIVLSKCLQTRYRFVICFHFILIGKGCQLNEKPLSKHFGPGTLTKGDEICQIKEITERRPRSGKQRKKRTETKMVRRLKSYLGTTLPEAQNSRIEEEEEGRCCKITSYNILCNTLGLLIMRCVKMIILCDLYYSFIDNPLDYSIIWQS